MENKKNNFLIYQAGLYYRFVAALIDILLFSLLWFKIHHILMEDTETPYWLMLADDYLFLPVTYIYFSLAETLFGSTFGKSLCRLKVRNRDNTKISMVKAFYRNIAKIPSVLFLFIGYLMILIRKDNRAFHDLITKTDVVKLKKI